MRGKKIGFIIDPIESFNTKSETTFFIMAEICRRGGACFGIELKNLFAENSGIFGMAEKIHVKQNGGGFSCSKSASTKINLTKLDALFLRKDPPVDLRFFDHLSLLELIEDRVFMVNRPSGIKRLNEKLAILTCPELIADSFVSSSKSLLEQFTTKHKRVVLKPLNEAGGRGVVLADRGHPSLGALLDLVTRGETAYVMAQKFLPAVKQGDKRILILDERILGTFKRVPQKNDFRGNLHSGARLKKASLTARDKKIVSTILPQLKKLGLFFVGIDVIDGSLTEVNVTSPMGIGEINQITGQHIEKNLVDWLEKKLLEETIRF